MFTTFAVMFGKYGESLKVKEFKTEAAMDAWLEKLDMDTYRVEAVSYPTVATPAPAPEYRDAVTGNRTPTTMAERRRYEEWKALAA